MKQALAQLLLLGILLYGGWLWLASPTTEPTMPAIASTPTWADTAWAFSKVALSALPGLLVLAVGIAIISAPFLLWRYLSHKHEVARMRAQRPLPETLTHYTAPRLTQQVPRFLPTPVPEIVDTSPALTLTLESVNLADLLHTFHPSVDRIFIGTSTVGPVYRALPQLMHVGLLGSSNSGKSTAQLAMAVQMAMLDQARLTILDPQAKTFSKLRTSPKLLLPFPMDDRDCVDNLQALQDILAEREAQIKQVGAFAWYEYNHEYGGTLFPIFNFVDELPVLAGIDDAVNALIDLARRGRAYGLYLVLAGQGFRREDIGNTAIRQQIATKFVLRCGEEAQVRPIGGIPPHMVQLAVQFDKPGMAIFRPDDGEAQIIRLPYIAPRDAERLLGVQDAPRELPAPDRAATITLEHSLSPKKAQEPAQNGVSDAEREKIIELDAQGVNRSEITRRVFGRYTGHLFYKVCSVLEEERR
jgi:hypothetical protein